MSLMHPFLSTAQPQEALASVEDEESTWPHSRRKLFFLATPF